MTLAIVLFGVALFAIGVVTTATRGESLGEVELRFSTPLSAQEIRDRGTGVLLPVMAHHGYALQEVDGDDLAIFVRVHRPRWTFYAAALAWPVGLLALARRIALRAAIRIERADEGSVVVVEGELTAALRHAIRDTFEE